MVPAPGSRPRCGYNDYDYSGGAWEVLSSAGGKRRGGAFWALGPEKCGGGTGSPWPEGAVLEVGIWELIGNTYRSGSVLRTSHRLTPLLLASTPGGRILFLSSFYSWGKLERRNNAACPS